MTDESQKERGVIRVHGVGFAGTVQAFVAVEQVTNFAQEMERLLPGSQCYVLRIRPQGGCVIAE